MSNNASVFMIVLENSINATSYIGFTYKKIYEYGYYLLSLEVNKEYLAVIMSQYPTAFTNKEFCYGKF